MRRREDEIADVRHTLAQLRRQDVDHPALDVDATYLAAVLALSSRRIQQIR
jgi:hypothetical protein